MRSDAAVRQEPWARSATPVSGLLASMVGAGAALSEQVLATLAVEFPSGGAEPADAGGEAQEGDLAIIERELARLFAVRELFLSWVQELRSSEGRGAAGLPAQFLRAWGDSTGRVIQLLRARRDLGGARSDALLDAVYAELEAMLPLSDLPGHDSADMRNGRNDAVSRQGVAE